MQKLNFKMAYTTTDKICPTHHIHLIKYGKLPPFCMECARESVEKEKEEQVKRFKIDHIKGMLKRDSLVDDPAEFSHTFANFKAKPGTPEAAVKKQAIHIAYFYAAHPEAKFATMFYGTPGEGKTHLAMAMLNAVNERAEPLQKCLFINVNSLFLAIRSSFDDPTALWTEEYAVGLLSDADLLVIDDLGSESAMSRQSEASNFTQRVLYQVTNRQKRIITTTNLAMEQLRATYNPKLISRLLAGSEAARSKIDFSGIKDKRAGIM